MAYWLLKTEPDCYSWSDLVRDKKTTWDGVTNALALKHLRTMKKGDQALIYHTGGERLAVGIAEIASAPYADPNADDDADRVPALRPDAGREPASDGGTVVHRRGPRTRRRSAAGAGCAARPTAAGRAGGP